jgi:hypothetical protein
LRTEGEVSGVVSCGIDHAMRSATLDIMRVIIFASLT